MEIFNLETSALGCILYSTEGETPGSVHRVSLFPGQSLDGQPQEVVNLAMVTWTPAVIATYQECMAVCP